MKFVVERTRGNYTIKPEDFHSMEVREETYFLKFGKDQLGEGQKLDQVNIYYVEINTIEELLEYVEKLSKLAENNPECMDGGVIVKKNWVNGLSGWDNWVIEIYDGYRE